MLFIKFEKQVRRKERQKAKNISGLQGAKKYWGNDVGLFLKKLMAEDVGQHQATVFFSFW